LPISHPSKSGWNVWKRISNGQDTGALEGDELSRASKGLLESEKPLREWKPIARKEAGEGFAFLSEKPMIEVENIGEEQLDRLTDDRGRADLPMNMDRTLSRQTRSGDGGTFLRRVANISGGTTK
jgi:hypothetical protein